VNKTIKIPAHSDLQIVGDGYYSLLLWDGEDFLGRKEPVAFTRSRPYLKNDNARVEQKNWTDVRQLVGYDHLGDPSQAATKGAASLDKPSDESGGVKLPTTEIASASSGVISYESTYRPLFYSPVSFLLAMSARMAAITETWRDSRTPGAPPLCCAPL